MRVIVLSMMIAYLPDIRSNLVFSKESVREGISIVINGHVNHVSLDIEARQECRFNSFQEMVISKLIPGSTAELAGIGWGCLEKDRWYSDIKQGGHT